MAKRSLAETELSLELEKLSDVDAAGYSDDSIADPTFSQNKESSSSSKDDLTEVENEDKAAEVVPLAGILPERRW